MKRVLLTLGIACLTLGVATAAFANNQTGAKVALQLKGNTTKAANICGSWSPNDTGTPCSDYTTEGVSIATDTFLAYLVVAWFDVGPGIAGLSCGIDAQGAFVSWNLCGDLEFPNSNWAAGNGGNRITWNAQSNCQNTDVGGEGGHAIAGAFYVYSYGGAESIAVVENQVQSGPELVVADCTALESDLDLTAAGLIELNGGPGYNPCQSVAVEQSTWGNIKKKFNN